MILFIVIHNTSDLLSKLLIILTAYKAKRDPVIGSWFVRAILDVVYKHSHHLDIRQLFQKVSACTTL